MSLWEERAARNEALFREVNERVEELHDHLESGGAAEFVCECGNEMCTQRLAVPFETYERVRSSSVLFLVAPGHERSGIEAVVERLEGFLIVKKDDPAAGQIADESDPRG